MKQDALNPVLVCLIAQQDSMAFNSLIAVCDSKRLRRWWFNQRVSSTMLACIVDGTWLVKEVTELCSRRGLRLHKFASNSPHGKYPDVRKSNEREEPGYPFSEHADGKDLRNEVECRVWYIQFHDQFSEETHNAPWHLVNSGLSVWPTWFSGSSNSEWQKNFASNLWNVEWSGMVKLVKSYDHGGAWEHRDCPVLLSSRLWWDLHSRTALLFWCHLSKRSLGCYVQHTVLLTLTDTTAAVNSSRRMVTIFVGATLAHLHSDSRSVAMNTAIEL